MPPSGAAAGPVRSPSARSRAASCGTPSQVLPGSTLVWPFASAGTVTGSPALAIALYAANVFRARA